MSTTEKTYRRIALSEAGDVTIVRFRDSKLVEDLLIQELANELFQLVDEENRVKIILSFRGVDFISAPVLGKFITLYKKIKERGGRLALCGILPGIYEVFVITKLSRLFNIYDNEGGALGAI